MRILLQKIFLKRFVAQIAGPVIADENILHYTVMIGFKN